VAVIGKEVGKTKKNTHAVWSALACQWAKILKNEIVKHAIWSCRGRHWQKTGKTKNLTHAVWSVLTCQRAKILRKMINVTHAIWSDRSRHWQKKEKQSMSCTPPGLAVIDIRQKKTKNVMHEIQSGHDCQP
jgi:hypothetical protein